MQAKRFGTMSISITQQLSASTGKVVARGCELVPDSGHYLDIWVSISKVQRFFEQFPERCFSGLAIGVTLGK